MEYFEKEVTVNSLEILNKASVVLTDKKRSIKSRSDNHVILEGGRSKMIFLLPIGWFIVGFLFILVGADDEAFVSFWMLFNIILPIGAGIYFWTRPKTNIQINVNSMGNNRTKVIGKAVGKRKDIDALMDFMNSLPITPTKKITITQEHESQ